MTKRSWVQTPTMETSYMVQNELYVQVCQLTETKVQKKGNHIFENHNDDQKISGGSLHQKIPLQGCTL
jgi:hypothetical protein